MLPRLSNYPIVQLEEKAITQFQYYQLPKLHKHPSRHLQFSLIIRAITRAIYEILSYSLCTRHRRRPYCLSKKWATISKTFPSPVRSGLAQIGTFSFQAKLFLSSVYNFNVES